ncbi:MAG: extracellular solute-binding protein [Armatimonadia bacterium]
MGLRYCLALACLLLAGWTAAAPDQASDGKLFKISVTSRYNAQNRQPQIIREFLAAHPNVRLVQWDGIKMPAEGSRASLAMAMAANIGPDIFETDIRQAVEQRLAYPLTEWIGEDGVLANGKPKLNKQGKRDLNGQIDADEAKWADWMKIKPLYRQVVTVNGKAYALPNRGGTYVGILYSKTLLRKAGLDPRHPPKTYDEFIRWVRLLYDPVKKTYGLELTAQSWAFAPWVATTGSSIVVQDRKCTACGKTATFNEQATQFVCPCGEDVSRVVPTWRCNVASPECTAAVAFYHRLRWAPWIMDRSTHEPVELTKQDVDNGYVMFRGKRIVFSPDDVVEGSIGVTTTALTDTLKRLGRDLAMYPLWAGDMTEFQNLGIPPDDLGMMPFPGMNSSCRPVLQASNSFFMIGKDVLRRGGDTPQEKKAYRDLVWDMMRRICSPEGSDEDIRRKVAAGQAKFLNPRDLERLGFKDYLREMPPENLQMWQQIEAGKLLEVVEPFMGKWLQFRDFYQREVIDLVLRPSGKEFDYNTALKDLERDANTGIMFERPREVLDQYRPKARIIAAFIALFLAFFTVLIIRDQMKRTESKAGVYKGWLPWLMLLPAVASIALWGYYPLARGLVMAFQDYKVVGRSPFVGLSNFISIALDPNFYHYLFTTFRFVLWNLGLAFCTPIILAFFLTEVPRFKVFFRTLFFLPQMTSGLVVTLMWKEMYAGTAQGTINRLLAPILGMWDLKPVDWLGNPHTVMACVILPSVWAAAGIGSLIYLAALKSVPEELYEAANIDGATILGRIRHITLPTIAPLVLINFVGAFIGTFQSMGQIWLLTFGGPGKETMVMGMAIWQEAYVNMRFSLATSYAWILGSILIGFTYMQLRILRRVDFRQAKGD